MYPWSTNHVVPVQEKYLFLTKKKKRKKRKSHSLTTYRHLNSIIAFIPYDPLWSEKMAPDDLEPAVTCLDCKWHTSLLHTELITQPHPPIKVSPFPAPMDRASDVFGELLWCLHLKMGHLRLRESVQLAAGRVPTLDSSGPASQLLPTKLHCCHSSPPAHPPHHRWFPSLNKLQGQFLPFNKTICLEGKQKRKLDTT